MYSSVMPWFSLTSISTIIQLSIIHYSHGTSIDFRTVIPDHNLKQFPLWVSIKDDMKIIYQERVAEESFKLDVSHYSPFVKVSYFKHHKDIRKPRKSFCTRKIQTSDLVAYRGCCTFKSTKLCFMTVGGGSPTTSNERPQQRRLLSNMQNEDMGSDDEDEPDMLTITIIVGIAILLLIMIITIAILMWKYVHSAPPKLESLMLIIEKSVTKTPTKTMSAEHPSDDEWTIESVSDGLPESVTADTTADPAKEAVIPKEIFYIVEDSETMSTEGNKSQSDAFPNLPGSSRQSEISSNNTDIDARFEAAFRLLQDAEKAKLELKAQASDKNIVGDDAGVHERQDDISIDSNASMADQRPGEMNPLFAAHIQQQLQKQPQDRQVVVVYNTQPSQKQQENPDGQNQMTPLTPTPSKGQT